MHAAMQVSYAFKSGAVPHGHRHLHAVGHHGCWLLSAGDTAAARLSCVRHRSGVTVIFTLALRLEGIHGVLCRHAVGDSSEHLPGLFIPLRGGMA